MPLLFAPYEAMRFCTVALDLSGIRAYLPPSLFTMAPMEYNNRYEIIYQGGISMLKIALAQLDIHAGDPRFNTAAMKKPSPRLSSRAAT